MKSSENKLQLEFKNIKNIHIRKFQKLKNEPKDTHKPKIKINEKVM